MLFKNSIPALFLMLSLLGFATQSAAQDDRLTIPKAAIAVNQSGPFAGSFDELISALTSDYLFLHKGAAMNRLSGGGPFTVFAPTDGAFAALKQLLACNGIALKDIPAIVRTVLQYHVTRGNLLAEDVIALPEIKTLAGAVIIQEGGVLTDVAGQEVNILFTNLQVDNGVIHVVDKVLLPAELGLQACGP